MTDPVRQMRLVVTAQDYDDALVFYRDTLGLRELASYAAAGGRVTILDAGRATLELTDPPHAAYIDEVEVGRRVAGHIRVAFEIGDAAATTNRLVDAGAVLIAAPTETPWRSLNARLDGPAACSSPCSRNLHRRSEPDLLSRAPMSRHDRRGPPPHGPHFGKQQRACCYPQTTLPTDPEKCHIERTLLVGTRSDPSRPSARA